MEENSGENQGLERLEIGWDNGLVKRKKDTSGGRRDGLFGLVKEYSNKADQKYTTALSFEHNKCCR